MSHKSQHSYHVALSKGGRYHDIYFIFTKNLFGRGWVTPLIYTCLSFHIV